MAGSDHEFQYTILIFLHKNSKSILKTSQMQLRNIPSAEDTVDPCKHDVSMIVAMDCCQCQDGQPTHEHCSLTEILTCDAALDRVLDYHQTECSTSQCPGKP
jgi:hypothetical protein